MSGDVSTQIRPAPTEQEAVAIVAALARFHADTAPPEQPPTGSESAWLAAARLEAVMREPGPAANL